jgi:thioredoxin 1
MNKIGIFFLLLIFFLVSCSSNEDKTMVEDCENSECGSTVETSENCAGCPSAESKEVLLTGQKSNDIKALITFVELGSVKCIPCKKMQPVMKAIEEKYGEQIKVIFYDVWKEDQRKYAEEYGIRLIPTQVFLDKEGNEFFRHEGFFPESEIDKLLQKHGLKSKRES